MKMFDAGKSRMIGLPYSEKNSDDMLSRFHLIPECNGQTDGQTDRFAISISRVSIKKLKLCLLVNSNLARASSVSTDRQLQRRLLGWYEISCNTSRSSDEHQSSEYSARRGADDVHS